METEDKRVQGITCVLLGILRLARLPWGLKIGKYLGWAKPACTHLTWPEWVGAVRRVCRVWEDGGCRVADRVCSVPSCRRCVWGRRWAGQPRTLLAQLLHFRKPRNPNSDANFCPNKFSWNCFVQMCSMFMKLFSQINFHEHCSPSIFSWKFLSKYLLRQGLGSCRKFVRRCHQKSDGSQDALKLVPDSSF